TITLWSLIVYIINALNYLKKENELLYKNNYFKLEYKSILLFYQQLFKKDVNESILFREAIINSTKYMYEIFNDELNQFFDGGCYEVYKEECFNG
ncbi:hypothetical protein Mgra_00002195, partial [Meloidogyne graminicola]